MNTDKTNKTDKIEIGTKVQIGSEIWVVCEIEEKEVRLGFNGQIKVFKK